MKLASAAFLLFAPGIASGEKIGNVPRASSLVRHGLRRLEDRSKAGGPKKASTRAHDLLRHRRLPKQDVTCSVETLDFEGTRQALCADFNEKTRFCITMSDGGELIGLRSDRRDATKMNKMKSPEDAANKMAALDMAACEELVESGCLANPEAWVDSGDDGFVCRAMEPLCWVWTVVNDADPIPNADGSSLAKLVSSYNPPSVNANGLVVFRARSTGQGGHAVSGKPETGIFVRDPIADEPIRRLAGRGTEVTDPNNLDTKYIEFPSIPRIAIGNSNAAFRGNHGPVLRYSVEVEGEEPEETRVGNTGLYCSFDPDACDSNEDTQGTCGNLFTAVGKLGAVPDDNLEGFDFSKFKVPVVLDPTSFDVFPGAPAINDEGIVAFKGNYAKDNDGQTGVFFRQLLTDVPEGGNDPIYHIASSSETPIPECPELNFGSTAAPSIVDGKLVFRGVDNEGSFDSIDPEDSPTCGGIYQANLADALASSNPPLTALVKIGDLVPDLNGDPIGNFKMFGEALSYDGRYASVWGAWSEWGVEEDFTEIKLCCPTHGQKDLMAYCSHTGIYADECLGDECRDGDPYTILEGDEGYDPPEGCEVGYQVKYVPNHQGIFVVEVETSTITTVAKTDDIAVDDFLFWKYSGKPLSVGFGRPDSTTGPTAGAAVGVESTTTDDESDAAEPPRWRSATSAALDSYDTASTSPARVAYKVKTADVVGIYLWKDDGTDPVPLVETGDECTDLDRDGHVDGTPMTVDGLAMDRDGFRGGRLALAAECAEDISGVRMLAEDDEEEEADWGGIYLIDVDAWMAGTCVQE